MDSISLSTSNLVGYLTPLGSLTEMTYFKINGNKISGTIPQSFFNMPKMRFLDLDNNQLTGSIPLIRSVNTRLQDLFLNNNRLEGTIPESLIMLNIVERLFLGRNSLVGTIPRFLGLLPNLRALHLQNNHLTGTIPVLDQKWLWNIDLSVNYLTMGSLEAVPLSTFSTHAPDYNIALQSNCLVFRNFVKPSQNVDATHCRGERVLSNPYL